MSHPGALELASAAAGPVEEARARLAERLAEVTALDAEVERLSLELAVFAAELDQALGAADLGARRLASTVRRIQSLAFALAQELTRLTSPPAAEPAPARLPPTPAARPPSRPPPAPPPADDEGEVHAPGSATSPRLAEPPTRRDEELKRVYRRLARLLHPDLAGSDADRDRLTTTMAVVNAAYAAGDLEALQLTAEKVGAGEAPGLLSDEERLADLARRIAQLDRVAASLRRELDRIRRTDTARVHQEALRRKAEGRDYLVESQAELEAEAAAARTDIRERLAALERTATALATARRAAMSTIQRRGDGGGLRPFDPLAESPIVRRTAARLHTAKAGAPARGLARWLEDAASTAVPHAALTLLAFFAEAGGEVPPPSIATSAGLAERWDALRAAWPEAPDLPTALASLPGHLVVGARAGRDTIHAGLQLASADLFEGVAIALEHPGVAQLAATVLAALGPEVSCASCGATGRGLHLLATRGLDERHAIVCPSCGAWAQRYWRFGEVEGLEALAPRSLELGLTTEVVVHLATASVSFGMLPPERDALTAAGLVERFRALYLEPCQVDLPDGSVKLRARGRTVSATSRVGDMAGLSLGLAPVADTTAEALLELLRTRVERRFRP